MARGNAKHRVVDCDEILLLAGVAVSTLSLSLQKRCTLNEPSNEVYAVDKRIISV